MSNLSEIKNIIITKDSRSAVLYLSKLAVRKYSDLDSDLAKLAYIRLNSLSSTQLLELLSSSLLVAYELEEYSLFENFREYLVQYNYVPDEVQICGSIVRMLQTSKETFSLTGGTYTVGELVNGFLSESVDQDELGPLNILHYLNQNLTVKTLTSHEKFILKDLLELYIFCQRMVNEWESLPDKVSDDEFKEIMSKLDLADFVLGLNSDEPAPDMVNTINSVQVKPPAASEPPAKPVAPTTSTTPTKPAAPEISTVMPDNLPSLKAPVAEASVDAPKTSAPKAIDLAKPAAPQTTVHLKQPTAPFDAKGLTFTDGHSVQAIEEQQKVVERRRLAASEELKKEEEIERKLAALKNRNKPNSK